MKTTCAVLMGLAAAGCDPAFQISGQVTAVDGRPVADALARASCSAPPRPEGQSDRAGAFHAQGMGFFADDCEISVTAPGYMTQRFSLAELCRERFLGSCVSIDVNAVLTPVSSDR